MPEFVNTGKGMQLIETNNASQVPFQQGNLIIDDSGSIYYDPTNKTDVSGRITVGKANEIIDLGTITPDPNTDDMVLAEYRSAGIYKYKFNNRGLGNVTELLIVSSSDDVHSPFYQYRITATNGILYRSFVASESPGEWEEFAKSADIPSIVDNLTSSSTSSALSANQGRILDEKIDEVVTDLAAHENKNATTAERGHVQLVNNLTAGGADKALTAEQGKQLKSALDSIELVESIGAVTSPLTSATTFKDITASGIYNFTSGGEVGYLIVGGQNNGAQTTQYMLFDNSFYSRESTSSASWGVWNKCLQSTDVVNNLTSGGTNVPLSAEQGKELSSSKADKATTLAGYGITDAYTKTDVDTKLSSVYKYIGSVTVEQLPQNLTASDKGNVYNLTNDGTINASTEHEETVVAGDNVAWTGDYWDKLAGTITVEPQQTFAVITNQTEWDEMVSALNWNGVSQVIVSPPQSTTIDVDGTNADMAKTIAVPSNVLSIYKTENSQGMFGTFHQSCLKGHYACKLFGFSGYAISNFECVDNCNGQRIENCRIIINSDYYLYVNCKILINCNSRQNIECDIAIGCTTNGTITANIIIEATGELSKLTTTAKTDLVSAINELKTNISNNVGKDLTGETFIPESGFEVTAGQNTEIFNDYRDIFGPGGSGCEGNLSVGDYSHTEGEGNISYGNSSHTQGKNNISIGESSHTEGYLNTSSGKYSHSEGSIEESDYRIVRITVEQILSEDPLKVFFTPSLSESDIPAYIRIGTNIYPKSVLSKKTAGSGGIQQPYLDTLTFPEDPGYEVSVGSAFYLNFLASGALGDNSHKEGLGTIACSDNQHVQGKYNIEDTESKYAHIVGNGSSNTTRSNAHTVDWSGNAWFSGDVKVGGTDYDTATDTLATQSYVNGHSGKKYSTIVIGNSASGLTSNDVDYLYTSGSDFSTTLTNAINALPSTGGEIKILGGIYTLSTPVDRTGIPARPIKITGEGKSTIIISSTPTDHYITASFCEISECRLDTDIRITAIGYVNIHDCEIAERIYINNSSTLQNVFIHDNKLDYTTTGKNFLYLSGSGSIYNLQVYNNYGYGAPFDFLYAAATKSLYISGIRNNHCPYGNWSSSDYDLNGDSVIQYRNTMTGNTFSTINFRGNYWCISNNRILTILYLYAGDFLDVMNNKLDRTFTAASGLTYANITGNIIDSIATTSPYVNLGTNARFVNNTIRDTNFSTTYIPGYDTASNKWGNNMWADGIDRLVFANGEEIGGGQVN